MRKLIAKLQATLRRWLLGEVQQTMDCLLLQSALVVGTGENLVRHNGLVLAALEELKTSLHALRDSEEQHFRSLLEEISRRDVQAAEWHKARQEENAKAIAQIGGGVDRLVELVTPKAERLQGRRPVGGWDQVETENLKQFEEPVK